MESAEAPGETRNVRFLPILSPPPLCIQAMFRDEALHPAEGRRGGEDAVYSCVCCSLTFDLPQLAIGRPCAWVLVPLAYPAPLPPPHAMAFQHEAAIKDLKQAALDAEREFTAKEVAFRGKESHLEDALKARWGRKPEAVAYAWYVLPTPSGFSLLVRKCWVVVEAVRTL